MRKTSSKRAERGAAVSRSRKLRFDPPALVKAAQQAVREALRQHKRAGNTVAVAINGRVVLIPPEKIRV